MTFDLNTSTMSSRASNPGTPKARATHGEDSPQPGSERRQALVALAADLFADRGYKATTVRDIADAAGVLSGSLYHHFASKESIIDELLSSYLDELLESTKRIVAEGEPAVLTLQHLVREAFHSLEEHRAAITVLQNERQYLIQFPRFAYLPGQQAEIRKLWITVLRQGMGSGAFRADLDPEVTYRFIRDAVWVAVRWFRPDGPMHTEDLATQYIRLILEGIVGPKSSRAAQSTKASKSATKPAAKPRAAR